MSNPQNIQTSENINNDNVLNSQERQLTSEKPPTTEKNVEEKPQITNTENTKSKPFKYLYLIIIVGIIILLTVIIIIIVVCTKKKKKKTADKDDEPPLIMELNEKNHIKTTMNDKFVIPSDKKIQVVGADYPHKNTTFIIGKNNHSFLIDETGKISGVKQDDFPLYYSFNATIINGSYLFKDVKCFKTIDLSKMDSSEMIDASNMFENSEFEEIYFGTENQAEQTDQTDSTNTRRNLQEDEGDFLEEEEEDEKRKE